MAAYTLEELKALASAAAAIAKEMGEQLKKYNPKDAALIYGELDESLLHPDHFPEDYHNKKLDAAAADKKMEEYMELVHKKEEYPLETRVRHAEEMKKIIAEGQARINELYSKIR